MDEGPKESEFDLRTYWRVLVDFRWLIVLSTVVVGAAVIVWTLAQPRVYEASTTIEYDPNPATPLGGDADPISGYLNAREYYETQNRRLRSRSMARVVVEELGLHEDPSFYDPNSLREGAPDVEDVAEMLRAHISTQLIKDTRIVSLSVRDRKPERARDIANAYARIYVAQTGEDQSVSTAQELSELGSQLDTLRRRLEESEAALQAFKEENGIQSVPMEDEENILVNEITTLSGALTSARQQRIAASARLNRLTAAAREEDVLDAAVFDEQASLAPLRQALRAKLAEQERESATYGSQHPIMQALVREVDALRGQLSAEVAIILQDARGDLREIQAIESGLRRALEDAQERSTELDRHELQYRRLYRERENASKAYQRVTEARTDRSLVQQYRREFAEHVDAALTPDYPVAPNRTANAIGGVVAGLVLGVLLAFGIRFLDRRIRVPDAIEQMGVTLLGVLPVIDGIDAESASPARTRRGRRRGGKGDYSIAVHDAPMSAAAECCRTVRTNLMFMRGAAPASKGQCLVVTGSLPQEGKTTVSTNIAASFAQSGKKVLIVDADLRKPKIHTVFGLSREVGLTSFIVGESEFEDAVLNTHVPGLDVMVSGPVPPNPAELLHARRLQSLIETAREAYDVVIFDSPPLGAVTDAAIVAGHADGTIVVARANVTARDAFKSSLRQLHDVGARLLGCVMNGFDLRSDGYYGRGYYYRRYGEYYQEEAAE
ncbi:MAG: polysaccharide biosynthesis tyrosine autokinase [Myxococcota bacterium]